MRKTLIPLLFLIGLLRCGGSGDGAAGLYQQALPIPPVLAPTSTAGGVAAYDLTAHEATTSFFPDRPTPTYGYNGMSFLGPTIRLTRGQATQITLHNGLLPDVMPPMATPELAMNMDGVPNGTTLHLHGLIVASTADLAPASCCDLLPTGSAATTSVFTPDQPSSMLWYHPHPFGDTGRQVYLGLAGLMYLDDPADAALNLPSTYGVNDLPLVIQDRRFNADRTFDYHTLSQDDDGVLGNEILVNGVVSPYAEVSATRIRLRVLNGSNRRSYLLALSDGRSFTQIGTDGGLLPTPATVSQIMLTAAGRADILVDFGSDAGRTLYLVSRPFKLPAAPGADADGAGPGSTLVEGNPFTILQFRVGAPAPSAPLPSILASLPVPDESLATVTRQFDLELNSDNTINQRLFDMNRIDAAVKSDSWEIWSVTNYTPTIAHPWHVHGVQFRVLDRTTGPLEPNDQGWKDTVRVYPGETVRMLMHFDPRLSGSYMFHCHILEHEDMGMMGQYQIVP